MPMLNDHVREQVRGSFAAMAGPVRLVFFEQTVNCETCRETRALLEEVAALSDKISLESYNLQIDREKAKEFEVDAAPAIAVVGGKDHGIRFYGIPAGYEFGTLIEAILDVSSGRVSLAPGTIEGLKALRSPVHIRVFVTPT